jgi:predicted  nucleic acid-binding Zn-ribbon protein
MKCPKCGFNSFEYYDRCKKCSGNLTGYKQAYSVTSLVLPLEAKDKIAAECRSAENATDQIRTIKETHDDIFSFDLPDDFLTAPAHQNKDPFDFDEPSPDVSQTSRSKFEEDIFANLLESTPQAEESSLTVARPATAPDLVAAKDADSSTGPGEFDLESFSWDDTPVVTAETDSKAPYDDFDSLFGETKEKTQK